MLGKIAGGHENTGISSTMLKQNVVQLSLQRNWYAFLEGEGRTENSVSNKSRTWPKWFICNYIHFMNTCEDPQTISLFLMSWLEAIFQLHWFGAAIGISSWIHMSTLDCCQLVPKEGKKISLNIVTQDLKLFDCVHYTCDDWRLRLTRIFFLTNNHNHSKRIIVFVFLRKYFWKKVLREE